MKNDICRRLLGLLTVPPKGNSDYDAWLDQADFIAFLEENAEEDKVVVYANLYNNTPQDFLIQSVLVPETDVKPPDIGDLLTRSYYNAAWSVGTDGQNEWIEPSLRDCDSKSLARGEQLVFNRSLEEVRELSYYVEILQKFSHVSGIHHMPERKAWCRLDQRGNIEDVVQVIDVAPEEKDERRGRIVLFNRDVLRTYATLTETVLVRMFDTTRCYTSGFSKWEKQEKRSNGNDVFYRYGVTPGNSSYTKGVQLVPIAISRKKADDSTRKNLYDNEGKYETFIVARDLENKKIGEVLCENGGLRPAFFRPEVLSKYKADHEKYSFGEHSVGCRNSWHLEFYDINEADQIYTFLKYLSYLPYEEQLHWKQFNERPKARISDRTIEVGFYGRPDSYYSPLASLKDKLRNLRCEWWKIRTQGAIERAQYPVTGSNDDWRSEILALDQLLVEGFEERWLRKKAKELGRTPKPNYRSLKLLEECVIGLDFEDDHACAVVSPLRKLHDLRSKLSAHASGETARELKTEAFAEHGSYRDHYRNLVAECNETIQTLIEAFQGS